MVTEFQEVMFNRIRESFIRRGKEKLARYTDEELFKLIVNNIGTIPTPRSEDEAISQAGSFILVFFDNADYWEDTEEPEGPFGGAFDSWEQYERWRHGKL